ncbi:hypothetical protein HMPREF1573_00335 [Gardnerella vaginalis JCP7276]|nr:hypothetical protein HMPREF1573_00335 [Gardnerella vaginalis JCP7276]
MLVKFSSTISACKNNVSRNVCKLINKGKRIINKVRFSMRI